MSKLAQAEARLTACQVKCERLEDELTELRYEKRKSYTPPKPSGKLDGKGAATAAGGGAVCAPVGLWAQDIVDAIYAFVDQIGGFAKAFMHLAMISDFVGAAVGFIVGTVTVAVYKTFKSYG